MKHLVFVYGTLKRKQRASLDDWPGAAFVGVAETPPAFGLYDLGSFPAMTPGGNLRIKGEVYIVTESVLRALDQMEGVPNLYRRVVIPVHGEVEARVFAYVMAGDAFRQVEARGGTVYVDSGDWTGRPVYAPKGYFCDYCGVLLSDQEEPDGLCLECLKEYYPEALGEDDWR